MKILVVGADRVDAGKTTFATGLVARLGGVGFKPRAGNDYWFDHEDYRTAIEGGRLYGKDAARLAAASDGDPDPEAINPVHRLWRPAPDGDDFIGPVDRQFVLDRAGEEFVVNAGADVPASAERSLPLDAASRVSTVEELNAAIESLAGPALRGLADRISATDPAVVESYGDIARPVTGLMFDRVAVIEPGRLRVYDGRRFNDACEVAPGSPLDGQLETRVQDVIEFLDPEAVVPLTPIAKTERREPTRVAEAYASAYDALLDG